MTVPFIPDTTMGYCYGCYWLFGRFEVREFHPLIEEFTDDDFISRTARYADLDTFGPGGFDIAPLDSEMLWLRFDSPEAFPMNEFTIRLILQARLRIP
jgi:hypothetical protein